MSADTVDLTLARASVYLERGCGISLRDAGGVILTTLAGRAWLTMEGDLRDIDLMPGAAYRIERDGLTLVNALEPSCFEVRVPRRRHFWWGGRLERIWNWLARAGKVRARARMARGDFRF